MRSRGEQLRNGLKAAAKYPDIITDVRGWGLINGMELNADNQLLLLMLLKVRSLKVYY